MSLLIERPMTVRKRSDPAVKPDPLDGLPQAERFKAVARELGCEATFKAKLGTIARRKPKDEAKPKGNGGG